MVSKPCFVDYQSPVIGILRNKASSENSFRRDEIISCRVCKPVFALSSKIIFRSGAPKEIVCEACFVDYQSGVIGVLRNKASSENSFRREGIISCRVCKPVFALSSKIIFRSEAPKEIVREACFVDKKGNRPLSVFCETRHLARTFPREGINFSGIANSVNGNILIH